MKNISEIVARAKLFFQKNKNFVIIGFVLIALAAFAAPMVYMADSRQEKTTVASEITPMLTVTPTIIPTATSVPPTPTVTKKPVVIVTPSVTITPSIALTPTATPEDPTKGAIKVRLLSDASKEPLANASGVNITIKKGDFSSTKSGAEVYFDNLTAGEEYQVYVDYVYGSNHVGSSCGSDCYLIDGASGACSRKLPARKPSDNQQIECYYTPLNP